MPRSRSAALTYGRPHNIRFQPTVWFRAVALLLTAFGLANPTWAGAADFPAPARCGDHRVEVLDATPSEVEAICDAVADVVSYFRGAEFSIDPSSSVIVRSRSAAEAPLRAPTHGYFAAAGGRIVVVRSAETAPWGMKWDPLVAASFLRHEFVHMAVRRILAADHARLRPEWHEFIAYAVQFALMDSALRGRILAAHPEVGAFAELTAVNEFTYGMDPDRFSISAYRTYLSHGGDSFVEKLLRFQIIPPPMSYPFPVLPSEIPGQEATPRPERHQ